jgi:hypothetical protein
LRRKPHTPIQAYADDGCCGKQGRKRSAIMPGVCKRRANCLKLKEIPGRGGLGLRPAGNCLKLKTIGRGPAGVMLP